MRTLSDVADTEAPDKLSNLQTLFLREKQKTKIQKRAMATIKTTPVQRINKPVPLEFSCTPQCLRLPIVFDRCHTAQKFPREKSAFFAYQTFDVCTFVAMLGVVSWGRTCGYEQLIIIFDVAQNVIRRVCIVRVCVCK